MFVYMLKAYRYRLLPTPEQIDLLNKHIGSVRFLFNLALDCKQQAYTRFGKTLSRYDLQAQLVDLKKECLWLKEINSQSLQSALLHLDNAYRNFFEGRGAYPTYKRKANGGSFSVPQNGQVDFEKGTISLPKFRSSIKAVIHRKFRGLVKTITIRRTPTGKFFASVLVKCNQENEVVVALNPNNVVGLDLGIKDFLVSSVGEAVANPKYLRNNLTRLKIMQRRASRKLKGSANQRKANLRVAHQHEKITNSRKNFLHQLSSKLVKNHDGIAIEDLAVKNLLKNHKLAQAISDVSWAEFRRLLEYKCNWQGKHLLVIGRFQPSTKLCSACGYINHTLTLADREWECPFCGSHHNRDHNAAINIKNMALVKYSGVERSGEPVESPTLVGIMKQEKFSLTKEKPLSLEGSGSSLEENRHVLDLPTRTFVMGDIHGAVRAFDQVLARAGFRPGIDRLIQTGDVCDGWPDSYEVVERLLALPGTICVGGNHDYWVYEWLIGARPAQTWLRHGGVATMQSYEDATKAEKERHATFYAAQLPYYEDARGNLFVHAGYDPEVPIEQQSPVDLCWDRDFWSLGRPALAYQHCFIGHSRTNRNGNVEPVRKHNVWNLDQGAAYDGVLTLMEVDAFQYWQSDPVRSLYPGHRGRN